MNSLDRKLAAVIKTALKPSPEDLANESLAQDFQGIRRKMANGEVIATVDRLQLLLSRSETVWQLQEIADVIKSLLGAGFSETPAAIFAASLELLKSLSILDVLPILPSANSLDKWAKASKQPILRIELELLARPDLVYASAGADWLLFNSKSEYLLPLWSLFLNRLPRPKYLPSWEEAIESAVELDKKGNLLAILLFSPGLEEERISIFADVVRKNHRLLRIVTEELPHLLAHKGANSKLIHFIKHLFSNVVFQHDADRELSTALLARLGTGILISGHCGSYSGEALAFIRETSQQLRNLTDCDDAKSHTWVLENLLADEKQPAGKLGLNLQGARYIAQAIEKIEQGFPGKDVILVTARHLGLLEIGRKDEVVSFDPLKHEDVIGGLLPGETVFVTEPGLAFNNQAVRRAKVIKQKEVNNVPTDSQH